MTVALLAPYRELPAISGRSFLPISFLGRLPLTMAPVGILTFAAEQSGSFATAGFAAAATALGTAVGAPLTGALADRHGQRPVLVAAVLVSASALLTLALLGPLTEPVLLALCALAGFSLPQVGGMARARWLALTRGQAGAAMAFEGTADELAFVLGPALSGLLAASFGAPVALVAAAVATLVAAGAFATHPTHRATTRARASAGNRSRPGLLPVLSAPLPAMVCMGTFFASGQSAVTAYAASIGRPAAGGLIYALMAVGSALTALGTTLIPDRFGPATRCGVCAAGLLAGVAALALAPGLALFCLAMLATGLFVGPMLVTLNQVVGRRAPLDRTASAMAALSAGVVTGIALGALLAGALADAHGPAGALLPAAGAAGLLLLLATRLR